MNAHKLSILASIKKQHTAARFAKDEKLLTFLTTLFSEAARPGLDDGKRESTDDEVVSVIKKFVKGASDIIARVPDSPAGITAKWELKLLEEYLPKQLEKSDMYTIIRANFQKDNLSVKVAMDYFKKNYTGQYEGKALADVIKEVLASEPWDNTNNG